MIFLLDAGFIPAERTYEGFARRIRTNINRTGFHVNVEDEDEKRIKVGALHEEDGRGLCVGFWFNYQWNGQDKVVITQDDWASFDEFEVMDLLKIIQWSMMDGSRTHLVFDDDMTREMIGWVISKREIISTHSEMVLDTEDKLVREWITECPYRDDVKKPGKLDKKFRRKLNIDWEK